MKDGFQSSHAPLCRRQPVPPYRESLRVSTAPSTALGNAGKRRVMGPGRAGPVSLLILILTLELGGRELALPGVPDGYVGMALNWVVRRTCSLPAFHGIDQRCFCLLGDEYCHHRTIREPPPFHLTVIQLLADKAASKMLSPRQLVLHSGLNPFPGGRLVVNL